MSKVIITKGLPASSKSTFAREWVAEDPENRFIVEKDEIRKQTHLFKNGVYNHRRGDEKIVIKVRDEMLYTYLSQNKDVVVSDTNLNPRHITQITKIANEFGAEVEIKSFLGIPLKDLIERDANRESPVGEQVIRKMFHTQVKTMPTFYDWVEDREICIISDIDGTLTTGPKRRSPYEWHKVGNDDLNLATSAVLDAIGLVGYVNKIFLFSGRDSVCRPETEAWLDKQCIKYDGLFMRAEGDNRSDDVVKSELFEKHIKDKYNVLFVMDDRPRVCDLWRDVYGLTVFQLGDPNYKF